MLQAILSGDVEHFTKVKSTHQVGSTEKPSGKANSKALIGRAIGMVGAVPGKGNNAFVKGVSTLMMQGSKNKILVPPLDDDEVVELEVTGDVDIHATNKLGHTALHVAAMKGHVSSIHLLLNYGADMECRDRDGTTIITELPSHPLILCIRCTLPHVNSDTFS